MAEAGPSCSDADAVQQRPETHRQLSVPEHSRHAVHRLTACRQEPRLSAGERYLSVEVQTHFPASMNLLEQVPETSTLSTQTCPVSGSLIVSAEKDEVLLLADGAWITMI